MTQLSNTPMQPKPTDAVERLTLIEKLEQKIESLENSFKQSPIVNDEIATVHASIVAGLKMAINIVKQHKCTWQGTFSKAEETIYYTLSCDNKYLDDCLGEDVECFKYCPFCGGEIEFSEVQDD